MATRKKENRNISYNLSDITRLLEDDFGGDVLITCSKQDIEKLIPYINFSKHNIKFIDSIYLHTDNFSQYIYNTYGLIIIFGTDNQIKATLSKIKDKDISIIIICKEFKDIEYVYENFYSIIVSNDFVSRQNLISTYFSVNALKFMNMADEIVENIDIGYNRIENFDNRISYELLVEKIISIYMNQRKNDCYQHIISNASNNVIYLNIWLKFIIYFFARNKINKIKQSEFIKLFATYNALTRDIEYISNLNIVNNSKNEIIYFFAGLIKKNDNYGLNKLIKKGLKNKN